MRANNTARQTQRRKVADHMIDVLRAFKKGKTIQEKSRYGLSPNTWVDFDLYRKMNENAVQYRVKP